jgi:hypothetical protein
MKTFHKSPAIAETPNKNAKLKIQNAKSRLAECPT